MRDVLKVFSTLLMMVVGMKGLVALEHHRVLRTIKTLEDDGADPQYTERYYKWLNKGFYHQLTKSPEKD